MQRVSAQREALLERARRLGGLRIAELARRLGLETPADQRRHKGFVGRLVERALGVDASHRAGPDLPALGVEIKTLPVNAHGVPTESTFVCRVHLAEAQQAEWETSALRHKLGCVLWLPVEAERRIPLAERRLGSALLWSPSEAQWDGLRADWVELMGRLGHGDLESLSGHVGQWLQVRPKAAHAGVRTRGLDADAAPVRMPPRGFYLRSRFTRALLVHR